MKGHQDLGRLVVAAASAGLLLFSSTAGYGQAKTTYSSEACRPAIERQLQKLNAAADIKEVYISTELYSGRRSPSSIPREIMAWAYPRSCQGSIVMIMGPECTVYSTYSKGECKYDGLKNYE